MIMTRSFFFVMLSIGLSALGMGAGCASAPQRGAELPAADEPLARGEQAFHAGELERADRILSDAIAELPTRADLWNARGFVRMHRGRIVEAADDFRSAIELDPQNVQYHGNLAVLYLETDHPDAAAAELDRVLARSPASSTALNHRGLAHSRRGRYNQAVADFTAALRLDPANAQVHLNRGVAYAKLGAAAEAEADFDLALRIDPRLRQAYESRGLLELVEGELDEAIADFSRAIELGARDGLVHYNRAVAFSLSGEKASAEKDYETACERGVPQGCLGVTDDMVSVSGKL